MKRPEPSQFRAPRPMHQEPSAEFPANLVVRGYRHWGRMSVDPKRHLMWRYGGAPALDAAAVEEWMRRALHRIVVRFRDNARPSISIALATFLAHAERFDEGHGLQFACARQHWVQDDEKQTSLFEP